MSSSCDRSYRSASNSRKRRMLALQLAQRQEAGLNAAPIAVAMRRRALESSTSRQPVIIPADEVVRIDVFQDSDNVSPTRVESLHVAQPVQLTDAEGRHLGSDFHPFKELLFGTKPAAWVFAGDSITLGAKYTDGGRNYCEHFAEKVRSGLGRHHDVVINTSAPDETSQSLLEDLEWRALRFQPAVVSVMVGVNDAAAGPVGRSEFRRNLEHIVACIRAEGALVLLHTPPRIDLATATTHADLRAYVRLVRDVARESDVTCVDHWAFWKKAAAEGENVSAWLAADGLHPTAAGHRALSDLLVRRLEIFDRAVQDTPQ